MNYTPYGYSSSLLMASCGVGYDGERIDRISGCYPLGGGLRSYSPVLMRFTSSDFLSPFDEGGINAYCFCACDPINYVDPSGAVKIGILKSKNYPDTNLGFIKNRIYTATDSKTPEQLRLSLTPRENTHNAPSRLMREKRALKNARRVLMAPADEPLPATGILAEDLEMLKLVRRQQERVKYAWHAQLSSQAFQKEVKILDGLMEDGMKNIEGRIRGIKSNKDYKNRWQYFNPAYKGEQEGRYPKRR